MSNKKTYTINKNIIQIILVDSSIILLMLFLPSLSHLVPFPLYKMEPMRIMVLIGYLLSANKKNAYGLALLLPLVSFIVSGHPVLIKTILIAGELTINILLFSLLMNKKIRVSIAMFLSILLSKLFYYAIKFLMINVGLMNTNLVDTNIGVQLIISCGIALVFAKIYKHVYNE